jgi:hypothetical protein
VIEKKMIQHMNDQRHKREQDMNFEETAGMTEEMFESEDATTTLINVSERMIG